MIARVRIHHDFKRIAAAKRGESIEGLKTSSRRTRPRFDIIYIYIHNIMYFCGFGCYFITNLDEAPYYEPYQALVVDSEQSSGELVNSRIQFRDVPTVT